MTSEDRDTEDPMEWLARAQIFFRVVDYTLTHN